MTISIAREFLFWCSVINYGILLLASLVIWVAHDALFRLVRIWFSLTVEQFDLMNYGWMSLYKIGIILFNLVPYIALRIAT